jgi:polar amino acid transport system substrate-binding protein
MMLRRPFLIYLTSLAALAAMLGTGCGTVAPQTLHPYASQAAVLAPTGPLRIGVYTASPVSMVVDAETGEKKGVALALGQALAKELGRSFEVIEFSRLPDLLVAMRTVDGRGNVQSPTVDFTFASATPLRSKEVNFTAPLVYLELGYLVPHKSRISHERDVDQVGMRVGVPPGSAARILLSQTFQKASLQPTSSLQSTIELLAGKQLDAFATNKALLIRLLDSLPAGQFHILNNSAGFENLAIALPKYDAKDRELVAPFIKDFIGKTTGSGLLQKMIDNVGLNGFTKTAEWTDGSPRLKGTAK